MKQRYQVLILGLFFVFASVSVYAQRSVSGTVSDSQGNSMPGVNVIVQGTSSGTTTDSDGRYTVDLGNGTVLVFSFIGYNTQEVQVGTRSTVDVTMAEDIQQLSEVVVTALGVEREVKALNYSVTEVSGDNFVQARENNLASQLSGRIAGVNVSKAASGPAGSSRVVIRGNKSLGGGNPLYVIDGIPMDNGGFGQAGLWGGRDEGDGLSSINPDDIESITVLKGASAAALYGGRAGYGVINITTKKGSARKGLGIEFNSNYVAETINDLRETQRKYGAGGYQSEVATAPSTLQQAFGWGSSAWGPALDGSSVLQFDGVARPYSYAGDNWDRFYETGHAFTNSLSVSGGGENQTFRFSMSDLRSTSVLPNAGFDRTNVTMSTNAKFADKLTLTAKIMYSHEDAHNRPVLSDSPGNAVQSMWNVPNNVDVNIYRGNPNKLGAIPEGISDELLLIYGQGGDPRTPGQEWLPASNNWGQNPYWAAYQMVNDDLRDRIIGSASLRYDITDFLWASGRIGLDWYTRRDESLTPQGTGYQLGGALSIGEDRVNETNLEWMLGLDKTFGKISVNAFVGGNKMHRQWERIAANGNGFNVAFFPAINNSRDRNFGYGFNESGINSLFGSAEIGYNGILFLTATGRNDWFSVLNPEFNSLFYPSVGAAFVFSDAFSELPSWLSFGKFRATWAQVATANYGPYRANLTYSLSGASHLGRTMATFSQAGGNNGTIPNPDIAPALSTEFEFGLDLRFFNNRLGLDIAYYSQKTTDDILGVTISRASGFGATDVNLGEITNKGIELLLTGTPVQGPLTWDVSLNMAKNDNEVVYLAPGLNEIVGEEPRTRNVFIKHIVGQPFGTITGRVQQRDPNGNLIFREDGRPVASSTYVPIGNGIADWTGGLNNSFTWKGFNVSFLIDFKIGGDIFSGTNNRLTQNGWHKQSLLGREGEAPLHITGVVNTGTSESPVYTPVDRDLTPQEARDYWGSVGGEATAISDMFIYDASFTKLRQVVIGYSLPRTMLTKTPFQKVMLSFVGRNLAIISKNVENVDPESTYSTNPGAQGLEYFAMPATRSYGFNLSLGF